MLWTALPREATTTELVLDVFVSPRLGIDATKDAYTLSEFPEFEHWPKTLRERLTFSVAFADGSVHAATVEPTALDEDAWNHIFRGSTFVRPWSFRDLSDIPIYSYPARFVTAYLRDLYRDVGRKHPTAPPTPGDMGPLLVDLGSVTDVRPGLERKPPPADLPRQLPESTPTPGPEPPPEPEGCLAALCRLLRPLDWLLGPIWRRIRIWLGLPPLCKPKHQPPPDPTKPKSTVPRKIHPSPYQVSDPIPPAALPNLVKLEQLMTANKVIPPSPSVGDMKAALAARDPAFDFTRVMRFYERPEGEPPPGGWPEPALPKLDFHQALGALGDYPAMLRMLGLLVRLRVPRPAADPGSVRALPAWDGSHRATDVCPRTRCVLDGDRFAARHRGGEELDRGMLDLAGASDRLKTDTPKFDVIQVDTDGAAIKAVLQAASLERAAHLLVEGVLDEPLFSEEPTAALRSGGLAIVRPDRAAYVHGRLVSARALSLLQPGPAPDQPATLSQELFAEDLVRGYRVEVSEDGGGTWRSLCWRVGQYRLVDDAGVRVRDLPEIVDEGYLKSTSATSGDGAADPLYVHEALARWTGWSLTVPRPGRTLEPATKAAPRAAGEHYEEPRLPSSDPTQTEFRFAVTFTPKPGSLPRLRFGGRYRLRAFGVDLSGEPLDKPTTSSPSSDEITYRRFEPAGPPAPLALRRYRPGESLERMVVRSDYDRDSATWDSEEMSGAPADSVARRTRHLFPPKTSQQMVELHGKLDGDPFKAFGPGADPAVGYRLSLREQGTFRDHKVFDVHTVDVDNPVATIDFGTPRPITPANPNDPGTYVVNREDGTLPMPYLPDPAVAGAALRGVPGLVDHVSGDPLTVHKVDKGDGSGLSEPLLQIPFTGSWPDLHPFRLRAAEAAGGGVVPHWDKGERVLTIFLPKATHAEIRYSSYVRAGELDRHGIWDWLEVSDPTSKLREQAQVGAHWMISPPRTLVLVHAVQRPLSTAHFTTLAANRKLAETTADLVGKLHLDAASTGRIDVIGHWQEWRDPVDGKHFDEREAVACDFSIEPAWGNTPSFPLPPPADAARARHEFGDTKHRFVDYRVRATTRFRDYLNPAIPVKKLFRDSETSQILRVSVPSSTRPDPPRVLYAVPAFGRTAGAHTPGWTTHTEARRGGGLRVYLGRPWYSSGEGELLAVVLQANEAAILPEELRSRYGADAIWRGSVPHAVNELVPSHFTNRADEDTGVSLAGHPGLKATIAAFKPEWDGTRGLWFCDIEVDVAALPWNYWPFVRFAFARYQREALPDAKLSSIAIGEFAQLAPDRHLSLVWQGTQKVDVTLSGRAPVAPSPPPGAAFRVQVAPSGLGHKPDELDWEHAGGHSPSVDWHNFNTLVQPSGPDGDGNVTWEQTVTLPAPRGTRLMRLEVAEYEFLRTDEDLGPGVPRLTYAAHVLLD